jgi:hypothetical protein
MNRSWLRLLGLVLATGSASCATVTLEQQARSEIGPRIEFDLSCPAGQVRFHCLDQGCYTVGASGCGQKCTYVYLHDSGQWILNGAGGTGSRN